MMIYVRIFINDVLSQFHRSNHQDKTKMKPQIISGDLFVIQYEYKLLIILVLMLNTVLGSNISIQSEDLSYYNRQLRKKIRKHVQLRVIRWALLFTWFSIFMKSVSKHDWNFKCSGKWTSSTWIVIFNRYVFLLVT